MANWLWRPSVGGPKPWVSHFYGERLGFIASTFSIGWIIAGGSTGLALGIYVYSMFSYAGQYYLLVKRLRTIYIAKVLFWSSLTFIAVYTWALIGLVGTLPYEEVVKFYEAIYTTSAYKLWGAVGGIVIAFAAWLAASTSLLMGTMYQLARDLYGLAKRGYRVPMVWIYSSKI